MFAAAACRYVYYDDGRYLPRDWHENWNGYCRERQAWRTRFARERRLHRAVYRHRCRRFWGARSCIFGERLLEHGWHTVRRPVAFQPYRGERRRLLKQVAVRVRAAHQGV